MSIELAQYGTYKFSQADATNEIATAAIWGGKNFFCTTIVAHAYNTAAHSGTHTVKLYNASGALEHTMLNIHLNGAATANHIITVHPNVFLPQSYSIRVQSTNAKTDTYCSVMGFTTPLDV